MADESATQLHLGFEVGDPEVVHGEESASDPFFTDEEAALVAAAQMVENVDKTPTAEDDPQPPTPNVFIDYGVMPEVDPYDD